MSNVHPRLQEVTDRVRKRSREQRTAYLNHVEQSISRQPTRARHACANLAHGFAGNVPEEKILLRDTRSVPDIGIVSSYNDMLSAHQPLQHYPPILKEAVAKAGGIAQFAGGVPAMCDGVTQGTPGMELSLFSRDVIAMSTAVALSHAMFDGMLLLGICDKIVPGLVMGALHFGHLPGILVPGGPMTSGISNSEKAKVRQLFAEGKVGRDELLESEAAAYHSAGTCTFYGTANSNQMLMEIMGLHMPGAAFINPGTPLRDALTRAAGRRICEITALGNTPIPIGKMLDERSFVNAIVGLLATGGSTNHTLHLVAMARAAGIVINWDDFSDLSDCVPLLARVYPNGQADVNHFHAAGGLALVIRELLDAGLLHEDVQTVMGESLRHYTKEPFLDDGKLVWRDAPTHSADENIVRGVANPFSKDGGLKLLVGNLGRAVIKTSAVPATHHLIKAPAAVFEDQESVAQAFKEGRLNRDVIVVVRFQGPQANGMPELHKLTPMLGVLQDKGYKVALVTDGRMSGASGKVPAAIHVSPEALSGGPLAKVRDGDMLVLDAVQNRLYAEVEENDWNNRRNAEFRAEAVRGFGRELFARFRETASAAELGASPLI
ncbi:phosphogluconate dehydratase [Permianibacter aggregans]|uniref:Phosphogluconate dehydratase n=1 Tax=Permianibacter aggregans TaxID=1510150 RepID=A0A4R6UJF0_9GAMM|nr:phosphogluconate dehydratase [Permianibacter aggregans]QGX38445.1 phosphogluconate dehydratase [Permianibacter aggregans]TDQ45559.1 6-phosphogluconate dehydratase [Permianibacter aggregans]